MGQKVNPIVIRTGITRDAKARWVTKKKSAFADMLFRDMQLREYLQAKLGHAGISNIQIDRPAKNAVVTIKAARPGIIIGRKGEDTEKLRAQASKIMGVPVHVNVEEVRKQEMDAKLVAETIAQQLEKRIMFRRAMKRAVSSALRAGALGIKVRVAGRLGGAEIARSEWYREGRVPLHTFRADIDYGTARAQTTYGVIGVKVWIYKGDVFQRGNKQEDNAGENSKTDKSRG
ncbi:MAG: 30S ribosomal protein S3 [marine bacterium B5-7]|nr:MAG: 30S ribosomal protein S3 [marine bacterium B5-7]